MLSVCSKQSRTGLQIYQRVVHFAAASHVSGAIAELGGGVNQVSTVRHAIGSAGALGAGVGFMLAVWARTIPGDQATIAHKSCKTRRILWATPLALLLKKDIAEVGPMNLRVTHGAGLVLRRLIVNGGRLARQPSTWSRKCGTAGRACYRHHLEELRIGGTVEACGNCCNLSLHRHVLIDVRSLLVDVTLVANGVTTGQAAPIALPSLCHGVVAVRALHQTLVDAVVIRLGKVCFGGCVASVTQLRLGLHQQCSSSLA